MDEAHHSRDGQQPCSFIPQDHANQSGVNQSAQPSSHVEHYPVESREPHSSLKSQQARSSCTDPIESSNRVEGVLQVLPSVHQNLPSPGQQAYPGFPSRLENRAESSWGEHVADSWDIPPEAEDPEVRAYLDRILNRSADFSAKSSTPCRLPFEITDCEAFETEQLKTIRREPRFSKKPKATYTLRVQGFNCKGILPCEALQFADMEEMATQPATQPFLDPRRRGNNSMLTEDDELDVVCILHPASPAAYLGVGLVAKYSSQHILQNEGLSQVYENDSNLASSTQYEPPSVQDAENDDLDADTQSCNAFSNDGPAMDIALRLSSRLKNPPLGYAFGRMASKCDLVISDPDKLIISGMHFRIFLNQYGVLMLEDTSTNGTLVDSHHLKGNPKPTETWFEKKRMLNSGSIIEVLLDIKAAKKENVIRFIVKFPSRDHTRDRWNHKVASYLEYLNQIERREDVFAQAEIAGTAITRPPVPLNPAAGGPHQIQPPNFDDNRTLAAGSENRHHGMEWNGGDDYNVVGYIGKGAFASVYKLATKRDGDLYAVKQIEKRHFMKNGILDQKVHNELLIMKRLQHPYIIRFVGHEEKPNHLYIIMEYVPYGDLTAYTHSGLAMPEFHCQSVARQICQALEYLHKSNITHRDIKPDNILVHTQNPFVVKLSDFGLSKHITSDATLLQTFCGTLLYCAPEIYPGYELHKSGIPRKRHRANDPRMKTSPYKQSVDVWAFAAVLYHLLCGSPPFAGSVEDRGAEMLETVMSMEVDYERLHRCGVSADGIDFVAQMLVIEPESRATEVDCLRHPWIAEDKADTAIQGPPIMIGAVPDEDDELDASQLSLIDNPQRIEIGDSDLEYDTDVDDFDDTRQSKRFKAGDEEVNGEVQLFPSSDDITYPSLLKAHGGNTLPSTQNQVGGNRLFGEIGASALRSSGVLKQVALEMLPPEGSDGASTNYSNSQITDNSHDDCVTNDGVAQRSLQYPQIPAPVYIASAPSLFGTEALVDELNMASPESGGSGTSLELSSATPKTPESRANSPQPAPGRSGSKRSSQIFHSSDQTTPKRAKTSRSEAHSQRSYISKPLVERGSPTSIKEQSVQPKPLTEAPNKSSTAVSIKEKTADVVDSHRVKLVPRIAGNSQTGSIKETVEEPVFTLTNDRAVTTSNTESFTKSASTSITRDTTTAEAKFARPLPRLGVLTAVPGSAYNTVIKLEGRITLYGRDPTSTVVHRDSMERRIPKNALDIIFWRPGIEADIDKGRSWVDDPQICAIVRTRTSVSIKVNGTELTRGEGCWNYGRVYTGDIITIFGPESRFATGAEAQFLKFRCEFFHGQSAQPRPAGESFHVEHELDKYAQRDVLRAARRDQGGSQGSQGSLGSLASLGSFEGSERMVSSQGAASGRAERDVGGSGPREAAAASGVTAPSRPTRA